MFDLLFFTYWAYSNSYNNNYDTTTGWILIWLTDGYSVLRKSKKLRYIFHTTYLVLHLYWSNKQSAWNMQIYTESPMMLWHGLQSALNVRAINVDLNLKMTTCTNYFKIPAGWRVSSYSYFYSLPDQRFHSVIIEWINS